MSKEVDILNRITPKEKVNFMLQKKILDKFKKKHLEKQVIKENYLNAQKQQLINSTRPMYKSLSTTNKSNSSPNIVRKSMGFLGSFTLTIVMLAVITVFIGSILLERYCEHNGLDYPTVLVNMAHYLLKK